MNCKKILALLLTLVMLVTVLPMGALTVSAESTTEFLGGDGTEESPYLISNKTHLNNVRNHRSSHFKMVADITFTEADFSVRGEFYNDGQGWQPIGTDGGTPFIGVFDGNGHIIKGLYVNIQTTDRNVYAGLFGYSRGMIKNLGMTDGSVSSTSTSTSSYSYSYSYAGGIAGYNGGTISNCYNAGRVSTSSSSSSRSNAGGIAGYNGGTIRDCYNTGSVSATATSTSSSSHAGGIAGENDGTISNCYNTGSVSSTASYSSSYVGGIAGYNGGTISNCYNTGSVSATATSTSSSSRAGGIAGYNGYDGTISNCYNTGSVSSSSSYSCAGGIAGQNYNGTISNCYYLNIIAKGVGGGTDDPVSCTLKQMTQQGTFVGFDFDTVWTMAGNEDYLYPELQNVPMQFEKELASISVTPPTKTEYLEGKEQLDVTGGKLTLTYNNGTTEVIDLAADMVSGFDNTKVGKQTLTVTYQGKTTTFEVEIIAVTVPFRDVDKDAYYAAAVDWAVSNEITNGTSDSTFSPEEGCTRAQVVTFLWRAAGKPDPASSTNPFTDVKPGAYYYNAVLWAVEKGITNGTSGTTFSPDETCTRAQIVTFLWRYEGQPAPTGTSNPFADVKPSAYFGSAVLWAVEKGITNGTSATTFDPEDTCTRAQVVTFLYRDIVKS